MAECFKCKKEVSRITAYYYTHKGKIYCRECYNKVTTKELEKEKKEQHIKDAKKAVLKEYTYNTREFMIHLLNTWKPTKYKNETDYENALLLHFHTIEHNRIQNKG